MQHDHGRAAGGLGQQLGDPPRVGRIGRDRQRARVAMAFLAQRAQLGVGLAQDPR
jgi:hypothetical protein